MKTINTVTWLKLCCYKHRIDFFFFKTGSHYRSLAGLELIVNHAGLELRDPAPSAETKGMHHYN